MLFDPHEKRSLPLVPFAKLHHLRNLEIQLLVFPTIAPSKLKMVLACMRTVAAEIQQLDSNLE